MVNSITLKFANSGSQLPSIVIPVGSSDQFGITLSVDWGDGVGFVTVPNVDYYGAPQGTSPGHYPVLSYGAGGLNQSYTGTGIVTIRGDFGMFGYTVNNFSTLNQYVPYTTGWDYSQTVTDSQLLEVTDISGVFNLYGAFTGCTKLTSVPSLPPGFNKSLSYCFAGCTSLNTPNIGLWNVRGATDYRFFLDEWDGTATLKDKTLTSEPFRSLAMRLSFNLNLPNGSGGANPKNLTLPIVGTNVLVDWDNGVGANLVANATGTDIAFNGSSSASPSSGLVYIYGNCTHFGSSQQEWTGNFCLTSVISFGSMPWESFNGAFFGCFNLTTVPTSLPTTVTNVSNMFARCTSDKLEVARLTNWDISGVTLLENFLTIEPNANVQVDDTLRNPSSPFRSKCMVIDIDGQKIPSSLPISNLINGKLYVDWGLELGGANPPAYPLGMQVYTGLQGAVQKPSSGDAPSNTYTILVYGRFTTFGTIYGGPAPDWHKDSNSNASCVLSVSSWGYNSDAIVNLSYAFSDCLILTSVPTLPPNVTDTSYMFNEARVFNQQIGTWNVSKVTNMAHMFRNALLFTGFGLDLWDTSNVTDMNSMFSNSGLETNISTWNISNVDRFAYFLTVFDSVLMDTSISNSNSPFNAQSMVIRVAQGTTALDILPISNFTRIFDGVGSPSVYIDVGRGMVKISVSNPQLSQINSREIYVYGSFINFGSEGGYSSAQYITDIVRWGANIANIKSLRGAFYDSVAYGAIVSLPNVLPRVTDMSSMFRGTNYNGTMSGWDVSGVENMSFMFYNNTAINNGSFASWNTSSVTNMSFMFSAATSLYLNNAFKFDLSWNTVNVTEKLNFFSPTGSVNTTLTDPKSPFYVPAPSYQTSLTFTIDTTKSDTVQFPVRNFSGNLSITINSENTMYGVNPTISLNGVFNPATINISGNFSGFGSQSSAWTSGAETLVSVNSWSSTALTDMAGAFSGCTNLTSVPTTLLPSVTNTSYMFDSCESFAGAFISSWDFSNITNTQYMFYRCGMFNTNVSSWNVSNVIDMSYMFSNCGTFTAEGTNAWNVSNVLGMDYTFNQAAAAYSSEGQFLSDISGWNVSKVSIVPTKFLSPTGQTDTTTLDRKSPFFVPIVPGSPTIGSAVLVDISSVSVTWSAPVDNGGSAITGYTVTSNPGNLTATWTTGALNATVRGLLAGLQYTFTVKATNSVGVGESSGPSNVIIMPSASAPGAPTIGLAGPASSSSVMVTWTAPATGTPTGYTVTSNPGNLTASWTSGALEATVTGLNTGVIYTFTVTATNAQGTGPPSSPSNSVVLTGPPGAPINVVARVTNVKFATVIFSPPLNTGGADIIEYTIVSNPDNIVVNVTDFAGDPPYEANVNTVTEGTIYTFSVLATNSSGSGPQTTSNPVTIPLTGSPSAPQFVLATALDTSSARVNWINTEYDISGYTITSSPGNLTATWTSGEVNAGELNATVIGLTGGVQYTFTVVGRNSVGFGIISDPSPSITIPFPGTPSAPRLVSAITLDSSSAQISWSVPTNTGTSAITNYGVLSNSGIGVYTSSLTAIIRGLTPYTKLSFTVIATNSAGEGIRSQPSNNLYLPLPGYPGEPIDVSATLLDSSSALVTWSAPTGNGTGATDISGYTIRANPLALSDGVGPITTLWTGGPLSVTVRGLSAGTQYYFNVRATNSLGDGVDSLESNTIMPVGVPYAALNVIALALDSSSASVTWATPPSSGSDISGYTVTSSPGNIVVNTSSLTATFGGLTSGVSYTFTVRGINAIGTGLPSVSNSIIPPSPGSPDPPTNVTATALDTSSATITWSAPSNSGASAITSYTVTSNPGLQTATWTSGALTATVRGLTGGVEYTFTIIATNLQGTSLPSSASSSVLIVGRPSAPTGVVATALDTSSVSVSWVPPASNGGPITGYTVTSSPGNIVVNTSSTSTTVGGLTFGVPYTFSVTATNSAGTGPASISNSVTPPSPTAPGAPTGVTAVLDGSAVSVSWTAPASNGAPITGYTVTSSPGSVVVNTSSTSTTFRGLPSGSYTFSVTATNSAGTGTATISNSVTLVLQTAPSAPSGVTAVLDGSAVSVSWTAPTTGAPITSYTVTSNPGNVGINTSSTSTTFRGLPSGSYTFSVTATNSVGTGPASTSNSVTLVIQTVPGAPTGVVATAFDSSASVTWVAPTTGAPFTSYTVTSNPGAYTATWTSGPLVAVVTGLTNGTSYTFSVTATNTAGTGPASSASTPVTWVTSPTVPGVPTNVSALAFDASASVTWSAPANDGMYPITSYTITSIPSSTIVTWSSGPLRATLDGLTNGTTYTFIVTATNAIGTSNNSAPSSGVIPTNVPFSSRLGVYNSQPNPGFKLGDSLYGTAGLAFYRTNDIGGNYTVLQTLPGTPVGSLNRIGNTVYGIMQTPNSIFSYNTDTSTYATVGALAGVSSGFSALDPSGNLYTTDATGLIYKVTALPTFETLTTVTPVMVGALSVSDNILSGLSSTGSLVRLNLETLAVSTFTLSATAAAGSVLVDSGKVYYYDLSGFSNVLCSYNIATTTKTTLWNFDATPLKGTAPVGKILINSATQVLYGICSSGGAGSGAGTSAAGTFFSFTLGSNLMTILVNYVLGNGLNGYTPISFSITNEVGNAYVVTQTGATVGARFNPRVVGPFVVSQVTLPSFPPSCFNHGTKILRLMEEEDVWSPVETLRVGDLVKSYKHGYRAITHIGKGSFINNPSLWHTCMYTGQKEGHEPLTITGGHGLLVDYLTQSETSDQMVLWGRDEQIIDDKIVMVAPVSKEFSPIQTTESFTYYHFVLENDGDANRRYGVWANGFLTETPSANLYKKGLYFPL